MKRPARMMTIRDFSAHAAEIIRDLDEHAEPLVITQDGEAKAVLQDIAGYKKTQETLALLKILAMGNRQIEKGQVQLAGTVFKRLHASRE